MERETALSTFLCSTHVTLQQLEQLNLDIARESLRQAQQSFNLARQSFQISLAMTALSGLIGIAGIGLLLDGQSSEGTVTTTGGLASSVCFLQLSKDARERLEKANSRLDQIRIELLENF